MFSRIISVTIFQSSLPFRLLSMSGNRCQYYQCGKAKYKNREIAFHRIPNREKREEVCRQWILNSGNAQLDSYSPSKLREQLLCSTHFRDSDYYDLKNRKLKKSAVPIAWHTLPPDEPADTCQPGTLSPKSAKYVKDLKDLPDCTQKFVRREVLEEKNAALKKQCRILENRLRRLTNWQSKVKNLVAIGQKVDKLKGFQQTFVEMQLRCDKKVAVWTKREKKLAKTLYAKSRPAYQLLLQMGIKLPSMRTTGSWISAPEHSPEILKARSQSPAMSALDAIKDVDIDPEGVFKYILIKVHEDVEPPAEKVIVRGYKRSPYHADIYEEVDKNELTPRKLDGECLGGGRIQHNADAKSLKVYGYSQGFGKADHQLAASLLKKTYPEYNITCSDEGY